MFDLMSIQDKVLHISRPSTSFWYAPGQGHSRYIHDPLLSRLTLLFAFETSWNICCVCHAAMVSGVAGWPVWHPFSNTDLCLVYTLTESTCIQADVKMGLSWCSVGWRTGPAQDGFKELDFIRCGAGRVFGCHLAGCGIRAGREGGLPFGGIWTF